MEITCRTPSQGFPVGRVVKYEHVPAIRVVSVTFVSDHRKLLNWKRNWGNGELATRFPKPEWTIENMACSVGYGAPVSHSLDRAVVLDVVIAYEPASGARPVKGSLVGNGPEGVIFVEQGVELRPGDTKTLRLSAVGLFHTKRVYRLPFRVEWRFWTGGDPAIETVSVNHVFLTMNEPETVPEYSGATLLRMHHSVEQVASIQEELYSFYTREIGSHPSPGALRASAADAIQDPHKLVEKLVYRKLSAYDPNEHRANAWVMGTRGTRGNCDTISRYVQNICLMVGMPGKIEPVRIWPRLNESVMKTEITHGKKRILIPDRLPTWSDFTIVETPIKSGGLDDPVIRHPTEADWTLALIDDKKIDNNYEACVKLTHRGTRYYLPGAHWPPSATDRNQVLTRMFNSLSWVRNHEVVGEVTRFR
ncbi:MAG: hypothetical protein U0790_15600 [Isosphaeraceae bacterium]